MDDCWAHSRDTNGTIVADPVSFPSGMAALADYAHARGLKFGLYSSNSPTTCAGEAQRGRKACACKPCHTLRLSASGRPGSFGYETQDANTYASWGVDLLKYECVG